MSGKTYRMGWHGARVHNIGDVGGVGGVGKSRFGDTGDGEVEQDFHFDTINEGGGKTSGIRANCSRSSGNSVISNIACTDVVISRLPKVPMAVGLLSTTTTPERTTRTAKQTARSFMNVAMS